MNRILTVGLLLLATAALHAAQQKTAASSAATPSATVHPWTILVYGGADNNADGPILEFLNDVRKAIDDDPGIDLVLLVDRNEKYSDYAGLPGGDFTGARLFLLHKDSAERLDGGPEFPGITTAADVELDSADADNLRRFIDWGKAHYPAQRTGLMIYSHADGRSMCPDEQSGHHMGISELTRTLGQKESLDFMALELCNMGGIEISYEWRPSEANERARFGSNVLLAIPNAGPPLDWDRAFARIRSPGHSASPLKGPYLDPATMSAQDFGRLVIEEGYKGRQHAAVEQPERVKHEAAACYDLTRAKGVKQSVDALAVALAAGGEESQQVFCEMRGPGPIGDALNYDGDGPFVDLSDLCKRAAECDALDANARARASDVTKNVDAFVLASFGMSAYADFAPGKNGVFIVLPIDAPKIWKGFTWYTPLAYVDGGKDYGHWAFLADGATPANGKVENWFELLDSWFDVADDAGGVNVYRF